MQGSAIPSGNGQRPQASAKDAPSDAGVLRALSIRETRISFCARSFAKNFLESLRRGRIRSIVFAKNQDRRTEKMRPQERQYKTPQYNVVTV